ncbi:MULTISPECIES: sodium:solute symporter family protein [Nitrosopumilus]|uniref:Urea-proton symporter DUR3 n=1 Tax=Nitrosopumilus piranensis TaxID=1582439 RepID=A0A0C5CBQ4_9ARCH|nr:MULTISPECIES: sodium:solute symporter family protein [Nitrosopumilus]AJM92607.1 Urea-proton symporter DUR3 [Nitrosopumilus piranensis]
MYTAKSLPFVLTTFFAIVVFLVGSPQTVFAAGAISEGFAIGEALPEWIGWAIVVGLGAVFAVIISIEVKIEERYLGVNQTSEMFNTAGRTIKTGLTAAAIVSAWTWAATLLQSSTVAYQYGISGPFWYAAGASIQVLLFGILAIELKRKAPNAHTFLEIIRARFGDGSHKVFLVFALMTNMIVTAMLLLGGSAVVNGLTGMDISLAAFLIPVGVMIYTLVGGLKATFVADYMHTIIIFVVILTFVAAVYFNTDITGGVEGMYEKLVAAADLRPIEGNAAGAFLTMASIGGLMFGIINIVGNFGTVFVDQAYWQRAIAAKPSSTVKGFLLGGACWFAIPFTLATTMGLTAVALDVDLTPAQVQLGLVVPAAATALMGEVGAIMVLTMLFMAVTSAGSAELIAVSSLITYDIYRTYKNPNASGKQLVKVSRITIVGFGLGMGGLAVILLHMGLSLGFVYLAMGIIIGAAVIPIALTILWRRTNRVAATLGAIIGLMVAVTTWVSVAASLPEFGGEINLASLGHNYSMLFGNIAGILTGGAITIFGSLAAKTEFDWADLKKKITLVELSEAESAEITENEETLKKAFKFSLTGGGIMTLVLIIAWPMPLIAAGVVFDIMAYSIWVGISVIWVSIASFFIIFLPIIEARKGIAQVFSGQKSVAETSRGDKN